MTQNMDTDRTIEQNTRSETREYRGQGWSLETETFITSGSISRLRPKISKSQCQDQDYK